MNTAAPLSTSSSGAISLLTPHHLQELLHRLPAQDRADLSWAPRKLELELKPLIDGPLTHEAIGQASAALMGISISLTVALLEAARRVADPTALRAAVTDAVAQVTQDSAKILGKLPPDPRRAALRSYATVLVVGSIGLKLAADDANLDLKAIENWVLNEAPKAPEQSLAGFQAHALLLAILMLVEQGRSHDPRVSELAALADQDSLFVAETLASEQTLHPPVRLPWYFEAEGSEKFISIARWAESRTRRNDQALSLIEDWSLEDAKRDPAETSGEWRNLKSALTENHSSARKLFP